MKHKLIYPMLLLTSLILISCTNNSQNYNIPSQWKELNCGLYINSKGEIGFPSRPDFVFKEHELKGEDKMCPNKFITCLNDSTDLNKIIDTATFRHLGSTFYTDKNHIFNHYAMCDGGYLYIFSQDTSDFEVLNSCFIRHHSLIVHNRNGRLDAHAASFQASEKLPIIGRDKDGYFLLNERISANELKKEMGEKLFAELEKELNN